MKGKSHGIKIYILCFIPLITLVLYVYCKEKDLDKLTTATYAILLTPDATDPHSSNKDNDKKNELDAPISETEFIKPVANSIAASSAINYIGKRVELCDVVEEVKSFSKGVYVNFGDRYPHNSFAILLWGMNLSDEIMSLEGRQICVNGVVSSYKGKPQIMLYNLNEIRIVGI